MRWILAALLAIGLAGCTGRPTLDDAALSDRQLRLEQFFAGESVARGQFQDVFGTVRRRFDVTIDGRWDGRTLRLVEDFVYEDGSTEQRVWTLEKTGARSWVGTAPGVIGQATGEERGDTFNWQYVIDLPIPSASGETDTMRVRFDDWMWLMGEDRLLNRAYVFRSGFYIGDVVIWFERL